MKNSFIIYHKYRKSLEDLTNEQVGILFRAIFDYEIDGIEPKFAGELQMAFKFIRQDLDFNSDKYENICERNRVNGAKGGRPRNPVGFTETQKTQMVLEKPKKADNEYDIDIDIDNDILNKKESVKRKNPTLEEVKEYAKSRNRLDLADKFYDYFTAGNWVDSKGNKVKNWKQKFITWENKNEEKPCQPKESEMSMWEKLELVFKDEQNNKNK